MTRQSNAYKVGTKFEQRMLMKKMVRDTLYIGKDFSCSKYFFIKNNPKMAKAIKDADKFLAKLENRIKRNQKKSLKKAS